VKDTHFRGIKCGGRHWPSHTDKVYNPELFDRTIDKCVKALKAIWEEEGRFQAIAGSGNSALPMLGAISYITGIPMIAVRKAGDNAHDNRQVNGPIYEGGAKSLNYVFIDDFIATGKTFNRTIEYIAHEAKIPTKCIAMVNYEEEYHDTYKKITQVSKALVKKQTVYPYALSIDGQNYNETPTSLPVYFAQKF